MADRTTKTLLATLTVIFGIAALSWSASVTMPLAFSVFLVVLVWPMQCWLQARLPKGLALLGSLLVLLGAAAVFVGALVLCVDVLEDGASEYASSFEDAGARLSAWLTGMGVPLDASAIQASDVLGRAQSYIRSVADRLVAVVGALILVVAFTVLALLEVERWRAKLGDAFPARGGRAIEVVGTIAGKFRHYFLTRTFTSAVTGVLTGVYTWAIGLDFALVWGVSSYLLNYVPTLGSIVAIVPPTLLALLQFDGPWAAIAVGGGLGALQLLIGNYVDPYLQGRNLELSPLVVLFSIAFWGLVWGIPGALLGVPLTVAIAIVCRQFPDTRWIGELLADQPSGNGPEPP